MEIKYSNYKANPEIFKEKTLTTLIDKTGDYLINNIYDIKEEPVGSTKIVKQILNTGILNSNEKLIEELLLELEIEKEVLNNKLNSLSNSNFLKIMFIKYCTDKSEIIILDHIDACLTERDFKLLMKACQNKNISKTIIFCPNIIDNAIIYTKNFVVTENNTIIYKGNDFTKLEVKSEIMNFVDIANKRNAKLKYYKEPSDLLKAIYRSVKK